MFKKIINRAKTKADDVVIKKAKMALIKAAEKNGIEINEILTPLVEEKFDDLARTILHEHGYTKLVKIGLLAHQKK
ncbi:hypothetical protein [Desulfobacula sp.]